MTVVPGSTKALRLERRLRSTPHTRFLIKKAPMASERFQKALVALYVRPLEDLYREDIPRRLAS